MCKHNYLITFNLNYFMLIMITKNIVVIQYTYKKKKKFNCT